MDAMKRWLSLPRVERRTLVAAFALQVAIAVALRILPFRAVRRVLARTSTRTRRAPAADAEHLSHLTWAAAASGRRLGPASTCLTRSLAVQWLAARRGVVVPIHIGVRSTARSTRTRGLVNARQTTPITRALASFEGHT